jgi:UPF0755 protein
MLKRGILWPFLSLCLLAAVSAMVYWDYAAYMDSPISSTETAETKVVIPRGSSLTQVVDILQEHGVVRSATYFRIHLLVNDLTGSVKAGAYYFKNSDTPRQVAERLTQGPKTPYIVITIKEGMNVWQVASALEQSGIAAGDEILALLSERAFARTAGVPQATDPDKVLFPMEGFLFPETYFVAPGQTLEEILMRVAKQCQKELVEAKKKNLARYANVMEKVGLTDHEIVTLASLVEKETALPHEKKLIASVFINRLRKGMPLETDPTLSYSKEKKGRAPVALDKEDKDNPYNTYAHAGLPPGPICNPGRESLAAAVAPATSGFLYFVAKRDGSGGHFFTTNYNDHKKAVETYLLKGRNK